MKYHWIFWFLILLLCLSLSSCASPDIQAWFDLFFPNFPTTSTYPQIESLGVSPQVGSGAFEATVKISKHLKTDEMDCWVENANGYFLTYVQEHKSIAVSDTDEYFEFTRTDEGKQALTCAVKLSNSVRKVAFTVVAVPQSPATEPPAGQPPAATEPPALQPQTLQDLLTSGTYQVLVAWPGGSTKSVWTLTVSGNQVTGSSQWTCCPGARNDPLQGIITGDSITFQRECTGQGWTEGACHQVYSGVLKGNTIAGGITGTKIVEGEGWTLYLNTP